MPKKENKRKNTTQSTRNQSKKKHQGKLSHKEIVLKKLEAGFDRIQEIVKESKSKEKTVVGEESGQTKTERGFSDATKEKYFGCVENFVNNGIPDIIENGIEIETENGFVTKFKGNKKLYDHTYWKGEMVDYWFDKLVERHEKGEVSADYIVCSAHAFSKLQTYVKQHEVLGEGFNKLRVGLKGSVNSEEGRLYKLHCKGIVKSADDTTSIKLGSQEAKQVVEDVIKHIPKTLQNYDSICSVVRSQLNTGGRITAEIKLKVKDINFETNQKRYEKDKNNFSRNVPMNEESKSLYQPHMEGKNGESHLYDFYDKKGRRLNTKQAVREVQDALRNASLKAGYTKHSEEGKVIERLTSHSFRRGYAQSIYDSTKDQTKAEIQSRIAEYVNNQGSNKEGILARIKAERYRLNYYRRKNNLEIRDFTHEELRRLLVSLHLGHSRIDIVGARYITTDRALPNEKGFEAA
ncbi:tyrosine-type recombinase/integrase [Priestia aryabhattai]|uniref:tyrosine-type recombinase/integrase n=1 Tax=Priestia aryabhattai TaxID=412384 RepID=UPI001C8F0AB7|nr:tyrosine-type recombinase/integrase [Priestia aryabhattai]MBY0213883.1 tyrosine-type recombinase/integrase [Priestia aryabhattai]